MNKRYWVYVGPYGRHNKVGLMHGPQSGNFMIFYNDKIVTIDFKVFESKSYKFFIDEKLCEIFIVKDKKKNTYKYNFKFDTTTKTDFNIRRNLLIKMNNIKGIAVIVSVLGFLVLSVFSYIYLRANYLDNELNNKPVDDWATIKVFTAGRSNYYETFYYFQDNKEEIAYGKKIISTSPPLTPHGLPLENGDVFAVKYAEKHSFHSKINYDEPHENTALKMMQRVAPLHLQYHQGRMQTELLCEVQAAFDVDGLNGLADILYQNEDSIKNKQHNTHSFLQLKNKESFKKAAEQCWQEQFK